MSHAHKLIRDAVKTALTGLSSTGARAYANRLYVLDDASLPALRIYCDEEQATPGSVHQPVVYDRQLLFVVECCAKANAALDDACDEMQRQVEVALASGISISGKHLDCFYSGSTYADDWGSTPIGIKRLTFTVPFFTLANAPDTLI